MQIAFDNKTFQSKNNSIRFADDIARKVNKCYPRISSSRVLCYKNTNDFLPFLESIILKTVCGMRFMKDEMYENAHSFYGKIRAFIEPVKKYKLGNCGESAQLAAIAAKINGIKHCHIAHVYNPNGKDMDHAILFVNAKKPYIIDSWFGFADYVSKALNKYKSEYKHFFDIKDEDNISLVSKIDDEYTDFLRNEFPAKRVNKLKRMYPELCINTKGNKK